MKAALFGIGAGVGVGWWRLLPASPDASFRSWFVIAGLVVVGAFFAGWFRGKRGPASAVAVAVAEASAVASNVVNVQILAGLDQSRELSREFVSIDSDRDFVGVLSNGASTGETLALPSSDSLIPGDVLSRGPDARVSEAARVGVWADPA